MARWTLPNGGSLLGRDIVWETKVRYLPPPYFWFALWTAGSKWKWDGNAQGAEHDLVESFGYDNGGGNTNFDGRFWHVNTVAHPAKDTVDYSDWSRAMFGQGIKSYDPSQYHIWTWVYKRDNSYAMYVDGMKVQSGADYYWTYGNTAKDEPINMDFLFTAAGAIPRSTASTSPSRRRRSSANTMNGATAASTSAGTPLTSVLSTTSSAGEPAR